MKPESCKPCPYFARPGPIWGCGSASAKLTIIGQSPGPDEIEANEPFIGTSGKIVDRAASRSNLTLTDEFKTNIVKCLVSPGEALHPKAIECCKPLLAKELGALPRCKTLLTFGQPAFNSLTHKELHLIHTRAKPNSKGQKCTTRNPRAWLRGCPIQIERFTIIPTMHPAFLARTGFKASPVFQADVDKAVRISRGGMVEFDEHFTTTPTRREVEEYVQECIASVNFGLDIETPYKKDSEDEAELSGPSQIDLVGISARLGECVSVPPDMIPLLAPLFSPPSQVTMFAFNGLFDKYNLMTHLSTNPNLRLYDPMLAMHLIYPEVMPQDLGTAISLFSDLPYTKNLMQSDPLRYNAYDTFGALEVGLNTWEQLKNLGLEQLFWNHEIAILDDLAQMKQIGSRCNVRLGLEYELKCALTLQTYDKWWKENVKIVDWSSPKQLIPFFSSLGLPTQYNVKINPVTKARTKVPTSDDDALRTWETKHKSQAAGLVRRMRALSKAEDFVRFYSKDGRAHSSFVLHRHRGGRIQSLHPNLQNLSEELDLAAVYPRKLIIPDDDDSVLINADYEQIEIWCCAYYSKDPALLKMKEQGLYIHGIFYEELFKEPFFEPGKPKQKKFKLPNIPAAKLLRAKTLPIGMMHGRTNLDEEGLSKHEGQLIYKRFVGEHKAIFDYHTRLIQSTTRTGIARNAFGRIRNFPNVQATRNELLQFPDQSTASDILRLNAFIRLPLEDFGARRMLTVHDQILVSVPKRNMHECAQHIKACMELPITQMQGFHIPVSLKVGYNWGELVSLEEFELV